MTWWTVVTRAAAWQWHMVSSMQAKSHTYRLEFLVPLKSKQSILTADESCAEPKEYSEH